MEGDAIANTGLILSYILLGLGVLAAIFVSVMGVVSNPKGAVKSLIYIGGFFVVFLIGYLLADNEVLDSYKKFDVTAGMSKFIGALINTMWISMIVAGAAFVYSQVASIFK